MQTPAHLSPRQREGPLGPRVMLGYCFLPSFNSHQGKSRNRTTKLGSKMEELEIMANLKVDTYPDIKNAGKPTQLLSDHGMRVMPGPALLGCALPDHLLQNKLLKAASIFPPAWLTKLGIN